MPTRAIALLPLVLLVHLAFTSGIGLLLAVANLFYRDVKYLFELVLSVWMFLTSVLYPLDAITGRYAFLIRMNPMTPIIDAYRVALFGTPMSDPIGFGVACVLAFVLLGVSWLTFHRAESSSRRISDGNGASSIRRSLEEVRRRRAA
ncbi:MAG: ABC transporter permease [Vicinamibacterales bacterium]